jgi:hypothetical protein
VWPEGLAYPFVLFGILLVLATEQLAHVIMHSATKVADEEKLTELASSSSPSVMSIEEGPAKGVSGVDDGTVSVSNHKPDHVHNSHTHDHCVARLPAVDEELSLKNLVAAYMMEFSIASHSIIIGKYFALGFLKSSLLVVYSIFLYSSPDFLL